MPPEPLQWYGEKGDNSPWIRSWLRDNALPQPATVNDPVNVVRQGQSEQFFPVGRSGTVSELSWAMLGKGWPEIGSQWVSTLTL